MSQMKRYLEEVAADMGKEGFDDEVYAEAERRLNAGEAPALPVEGLSVDPFDPEPQFPFPSFDPHNKEDEEPLDGEGFGHHC